METVQALTEQIKKLQAKAAKLAKKRTGAVRGIVKQMQKHGVTIAELEEAMGGKRGEPKKKRGGKRGKVPIKYKDGKGNTWTGRGRTPRWLAEAEKAGKKREEFAV